jgi:uncharacterized protein YjbJ (UPF0337 family)
MRVRTSRLTHWIASQFGKLAFGSIEGTLVSINGARNDHRSEQPGIRRRQEPECTCGVARFSHPEDCAMDWNRVEGNWKEVKGKVKEKWAKLTDDDLTAINGQRDQLEGRLQKRYGYAKDQARKDVDTWFSTLK